jgi:hypothetical protein
MGWLVVKIQLIMEHKFEHRLVGSGLWQIYVMLPISQDEKSG